MPSMTAEDTLDVLGLTGGGDSALPPGRRLETHEAEYLARTVHDLYFEPKYEEFRSRTIWSAAVMIPPAGGCSG